MRRYAARMARTPPQRNAGRTGRVTLPKTGEKRRLGVGSVSLRRNPERATAPTGAKFKPGRYTPPTVRQDLGPSPRWVPVTMLVLLALGMLVILANYLGLLPGAEADNRYLLVGLVLFVAGFIVATRWR